MATIRPLKGLRFNAAAGRPADLVAPPYDVISPDEREALAAKNPHNVVFLTLPESSPDDRSKFVKYARSAARLEEWRREDVLALEPKPAFYRYTQTFDIPGVAALERTTLVTLIKVEPYDKGVVLPHEQTFPKHKEDRLRILEATRSHLECIFGLYEDESGVHQAVVSAPATEVADFTTPEDGIRHRFSVIDDAATCATLVHMVAPKTVWIADGHHRYETALAFREQLGPREGLVPEDFMMMALCSIDDPGLVLLPTHRILKRMTGTVAELKAGLAEHFDLKEASNAALMVQIAEAKEKHGAQAFGVALPGGTGLVATAKDPAVLAASIADGRSPRLAGLDVCVLHDHIFAKLLGLTGHDFFDYTRIESEALESVENGAPAAFLMNPPSVEDMRVIALGGEKMPQKSTYYYPKLLSGLVMWSLKDFEV